MKGKSGYGNFYSKIKDYYTEFLTSTFCGGKSASSSTLLNSIIASALLRVRMDKNVFQICFVLMTPSSAFFFLRLEIQAEGFLFILALNIDDLETFDYGQSRASGKFKHQQVTILLILNLPIEYGDVVFRIALVTLPFGVNSGRNSIQIFLILWIC